MSNVGFIGRKVNFYWGGNSPADLIPGVRDKGVKVAGSAIDVTSDESNGWRALLDDTGEMTVDVTLAGVVKNDRLKDDWFNGNRTQQMALDYPNGGILSGSFRMIDYADTLGYKDASTFSATFQSAGPITFVKGS